MQELIKITEQDGRQVVSARDLHAFLEVKTEFKDWIKRMIDYGFQEGEDFSSFLSESIGGRPSKEYAITMDCAKEIAMLQRSEKGKQARLYFIECEKQLKAQAIDFSKPENVLQLVKNWAETDKKRIEAENKVKKLQPKADFVDKVFDMDEKIDVGQAAKILELPFGRNTLFKKLREHGVFFANKNEPKQEYINKGYFQVKEKMIDRANHDSFLVLKILVTQKGLAFLSKVFNVIQTPKQTLSIN